MGKVGRLKMRTSEKGGRCTSAKWHLINLTCSQVERKQERMTHTQRGKREEDWTGKWSGIYRKETGEDFLQEDIVVGLSSITNPCPVNFMLSSPQAKRQCKHARVQLELVTDGVQQRTRHCFYISIWSITSSLQRSKKPPARLQSCIWITHWIKSL